jgi:hypothetical protein
MEMAKIEALIECGKSFRYADLFAFLVFVYAVGLSKYISFILSQGKPGGAVINTPLDLLKPILWCCVLAALPFAAIAFCDHEWNSAEAAPITWQRG